MKSFSHLPINYTGKAIRIEAPQHICWFFKGNYEFAEYEGGFTNLGIKND